MEMNKAKIAKPSKWLITGGCGFIGTSLIRNLTKKASFY
jgi:nucleoside-diphosphate-sugar epimerase